VFSEPVKPGTHPGNKVEFHTVDFVETRIGNKSGTQHERLRRRRFLAAATAIIIVETDAKITSSSAILSNLTSLVTGSSRDS